MENLTDTQLLAAQLLARGKFMKLIAEQCGVSSKTIRRWRDLPAFQLEMDRAQRENIDPTVEGTLRSALTATRKDGSPDWQTRVQAARTLAQLGRSGDVGDEEPEEPRTVIYLAPDA